MLEGMKNERSIFMPSPLRFVIALSAAAAAAMTLVLIAFAYPATQQSPRELPLAVAGPAPAVAQVEAQIGRQGESSFQLIAVPDRADAERLILDREAYGALVTPPGG